MIQIRRGTNLERIGAAVYALLLETDVLYNRLRERMGRDFMPISCSIKRRLNSDSEYIEWFETVAA